jgi:hypothetical protein
MLNSVVHQNEERGTATGVRGVPRLTPLAMDIEEASQQDNAPQCCAPFRTSNPLLLTVSGTSQRTLSDSVSFHNLTISACCLRHALGFDFYPTRHPDDYPAAEK